jgi:hypothetical protein
MMYTNSWVRRSSIVACASAKTSAAVNTVKVKVSLTVDRIRVGSRVLLILTAGQTPLTVHGPYVSEIGNTPCSSHQLYVPTVANVDTIDEMRCERTYAETINVECSYPRGNKR